MAVTPIQVQVGVEELALGLSLAGKPGLAKGLLFATFGEMPDDEEHGRLLSAGHSLMARGLLSVEEGETQLEDAFREALEHLAESEFIILYDLKQGADTRHLAYYVKRATILEQRLLQGVICTISTASDQSAITEGGVEFLGGGQVEVEDYPPATVPVGVLEKAKEAAGDSEAAVRAVLAEAGLHEDLSGPLARDLAQPQYRGSCLRIETEDDQFASDRGFLLLKGSERTWLFRLKPDGDEVQAEILPGTRANLSAEVQRLLA